MEEELKKSETRYRNIIAQADGVAYQRNYERNCYVFVDDGIEKITGYSAEEITPEIFDSLIIEEKLYTKRNMPIRSDMSRKIGGENATVYYADYILQKRDGQRIWITDYSIQNRNTNGELIGTLGMLQDITKRIETEEEVGLLAKLLDYAPASIVVHDFDGNFLYANQKTFEIHDYTKDEFMAKNLHEIDVPESEKLINERMEIIKKKGETSFRVEHYKKDGSIIPMDIYVKLVEWKNQKVIMSIATDMSDKLQAENALRESEEKYRELYEKGQSEYKNLENKYTELQNAYNELQKQYLSFQAEYENLKQKLSEGSKLEQEYAKLFSDYNELLKKYNDLNEKVNSGAPTISNDEIEKLKKENEELKSAIAEKENTINSLNEQVNSLESKIEEILSGAENSIVQAYETKFLELRKKEADLNNLAQKLQEKEKSLTDLENKLNEKENQLNLIEKKLNRYSMVLDLKIRLLSSLVDFILKKFELFLKITSNLNQ
jgi:PAS domain S-box-containing protein